MNRARSLQSAGGFLLLALGSACRPPDCAEAISAETTQRVAAALRATRPADGCVFAGIWAERTEMRVRWSDGSTPLPPALVAPASCDGGAPMGTFVVRAPPELAARCPRALEATRAAAAAETPLRPVPAAPVVRQDRSPRDGESLLWGAGALFAALAVLGGWLGARSLARAGRTHQLGLLAGSLAVALAVRLVVSPSPGNWYLDVLPRAAESGWPRYGPGAWVLQAALFAVLPRSDTALFMLNALLGALAIPLFIAILEERQVRREATLAAGLLFALAPLHVRLSASPEAHMLSSTLTLLLVLAWIRGARSAPALVFALLLVPAIALTRVEAWIQLAAVPLWGALLDRGETARPRRLRRTLLYAAVWIATGALVHDLVAVHSHQPLPDPPHLRETVMQFFELGFRAPFWLSPAEVSLALVGIIAMVRARPALLACIVLTLAACFLPLGRTLVHDDLLSARYFLAAIPVFLVLSGHGFAALLARARHLSSARWNAPIALAALAAAILATARLAYHSRYTFQDEYDFLRRALASLEAGCTVYQLPLRVQGFARDLDCCLDAPHSPLTLAFPHLRFQALDQPEHLGRPGCAAYYESAACALRDARLPEGHAMAKAYYQRSCAAVRARGGLSLIAEAEVSPRSTNGLFDRPPAVRLYRVVAPDRQP